jgi:hypothetical protein
MSFDLAVWYPSSRLTDEEALKMYQKLCEGDASVVAAHPSVDAFYGEITSIHPQIDDIPDDRIDDTDYCPWSIAFDRSPGHLIMCCVWSKADYCHGLVMKLACKHGLAVFNPQNAKITYPDASPGQATTHPGISAPHAKDRNAHKEQPRKPWWRFW